MKFRALFVAAGLLCATGASADQFLCKVKEHGRYNLIAPQILIDVATDFSSAKVTDGILQYHDQAPATAVMVKKRGNTLQIQWNLKQEKVRSANIEYLLIYKFKTGKAHVSVSLPSYDNDSTASGKCERI